MKTNKRKVRKSLKYVKKYSRRFDDANGKYFSILLGVFARTVKITHLHINCTQGQLNNEGGGELHEIKGNQDKTEIGKEHDKEQTNVF